MTTPALDTAAKTDRDARRFEMYFRWSLYSFVLVELVNIATVIAQAPGATVLLWVTAAAALAHGVLDVLVARWAFARMQDPGVALPRGLLAVWAGVGVVMIASAWSGIWLVVAPIVGVVSLTMLTPLMSWRTALWASAAFTAAAAALMLLSDVSRVVLAAFWGCMCLFLLLTGWSFAWVIRVLHQLRDAQQAQARLAVADERLRISRDLHDVFGRTLAAIAVKSELASELVRRERNDDAARELGEIRAIADGAGKEVRRVVRGEADVALAQEIDGARALLASAGIAVTVAGEPGDVPGPVADVLAWVVREGVTNVLRHSRATAATVAVDVADDAVTLTIGNDGADLTGTSGTRTGIAAMRDRVAAVGGALATTHAGGWFTLEAAIPRTTEPEGNPA